MKRLVRLFLLYVLLLLPFKAGADTGHLYMSDRFSSGLITCLCQDRYGFVWIGTDVCAPGPFGAVQSARRSP